MKINGTNINTIPAMLSSMATVVASLIEVTDVLKSSPDVGAKSDLVSYSRYSGIMFETYRGEVLSIWAGGVEISDIVNSSTWQGCQEEAQEYFAAQQNEQRTAAAENRADILNNK